MQHSSDTGNKILQEIKSKMTYGAPELKLYYKKFLTRGLIVAVIVAMAVSLSSLQYILSAEDKSKIDPVYSPVIFDLKDTRVDIPVKEAPEIVQQVPFKDLSALTPLPVPRNNVKEDVTIKNQDELENVKLPVSSEGTNDTGKIFADNTGRLDERTIDKNLEPVKKPEKTLFEQFEVQKAPVAMNLNSIRTSMNYPEIARISKIEGKVVARVLVGADGSVIKIGSIKGEEIFHDEVAGKIMDLQFTPAMINDQTVKCWVNVPFSFKLSSKDE